MTQTLSTPNEIRSAYSARATARDYVARRFQSELNRLLHERQIAVVQEWLDRLQPRHALEVAPGPGRLTRALRPRGRLLCLEYNQEMIEQGRPACDPAILWARGDGFRLPFGAEFDLVYSFRFVRHFHRPDRDRLYEQFRRVLQPRGYLIFDAVNERISRPLRDADPAAFPVHDELYRPDDLRAELRQAGFEPVALVPVQKCYGWQWQSQIFLGPRANWLNRLVIRGLELLPWREPLEWVVVCRRA